MRFIWTNGSQISLKVLVYTGIGPQSVGDLRKRSQNLAPVLVIISGNSLVFSRKIITSTGFLPVLRPRRVSTSSGKNQSPIEWYL